MKRHMCGALDIDGQRSCGLAVFTHLEPHPGDPPGHAWRQVTPADSKSATDVPLSPPGAAQGCGMGICTVLLAGVQGVFFFV